MKRPHSLKFAFSSTYCKSISYFPDWDAVADGGANAQRNARRTCRKRFSDPLDEEASAFAAVAWLPKGCKPHKKKHTHTEYNSVHSKAITKAERGWSFFFTRQKLAQPLHGFAWLDTTTARRQWTAMLFGLSPASGPLWRTRQTSMPRKPSSLKHDRATTKTTRSDLFFTPENEETSKTQP